eukprot:TRINITY_DN58736_c0_g1_i1.p1 TRINITY_DN58736_c0_g1~~TRINITY_DN58736_c0_g1_i1.p1  ORF type:complete len:397 (+),score=75.86 TRINITY_DN58736_c0_g1_i1:316-1506(+)
MTVTSLTRLKPGCVREAGSREVRSQERLHRTLERLASLLQKLPAERRRAQLLGQFTQRQRLQLERWLLERGSCKEVPTTSASGTELKRAAKRQPLEQESGKRRRLAAHGSTDVFVAPSVVCADSGRPSRCHTRADGRPAGLYKSLRHIGTNTPRAYFCAEVNFNGLRLLTKTSPSLERALRFLQVLHAIRERCCEEERFHYEDDARNDVPKTFEARFMAAFEEVPRAFGLTHEAIGLRFAARMRLPGSDKQLRTEPFRAAEMAKGLAAWRRLLEVRQSLRQSPPTASNSHSEREKAYEQASQGQAATRHGQMQLRRSPASAAAKKAAAALMRQQQEQFRADKAAAAKRRASERAELAIAKLLKRWSRQSHMRQTSCAAAASKPAGQAPPESESACA